MLEVLPFKSGFKCQHREIKEGEGKMIKVVIAEDDFRIAQVQEQFCIKYQM